MRYLQLAESILNQPVPVIIPETSCQSYHSTQLAKSDITPPLGHKSPQATADIQANNCYLDKWIDNRISAWVEHTGLTPTRLQYSDSRARLHYWQLAHLYHSLHQAQQHSLFYRERLTELKLPSTGKHKFTPENAYTKLYSLLSSLPFTAATDLAENPESFLAVSQSDVTGVISIPTSGTTGNSKRIFCTDSDLRQTINFFQHGMRYLLKPNDTVALLMSGERPGSVGHLFSAAMLELGNDCKVLGLPQDKQIFFDTLQKLQPQCIVGIPQHLVAIARSSLADILRPGLCSVLLSGDSVTPELRTAISHGLGCPVFIHYGLTETGLGNAVECPEQQGCHLREADLLVEIIDENNTPLPDGCWGEVVITTLTRQAMPLFRYRTGDLGRIVPGNCTCGSYLRRLEILGRINSTLLLPGNNSSCLHSAGLDRVLYSLTWVQGYKATLHKVPQKYYCLGIKLWLTVEAPANALELTCKALAATPGLHPVSTGTLENITNEGLPFYIYSATNEQETTEPVFHSVKQCFYQCSDPANLPWTAGNI